MTTIMMAMMMMMIKSCLFIYRVKKTYRNNISSGEREREKKEVYYKLNLLYSWRFILI